MQPKLKQAASLLKENEALEVILAEMQADLLDKFVATPDSELVALKLEYKAIDALRSDINARLTTYLETVA